MMISTLSLLIESASKRQKNSYFHLSKLYLYTFSYSRLIQVKHDKRKNFD